MSRVKGAPWDLKANAGDDINDGGTLERADARPPDPPVEIPPRINVKGCPGCQKVTRGTVPSWIVATHSDACRERMERLMMQDPVGDKTCHDEAFARHVEEHDEREKERRRSQDAVPMLKRRPTTSHYHHHRQTEVQTEPTAMCSTDRKAVMVCTSKTQT